MQGSAFIDRLLFGVFKPRYPIFGSDIAGHIEAVGKDVTQFRAGDQVFGDLSGRWGGFAEYVCAPCTAIALKPPAMSFQDAAAMPQAAMLALQGLRDSGAIKHGDKVLINGAGGGVGSFAIQIAKEYGVTVTGVDSPEKQAFMRSLGFDEVIDFTQQDFTRTGPYDLILDARTNRSPFDYARALSPNGRYVTVGGSMARLFQIMLAGPLIAMTSKKSLRVVVLKPNKDLAYLCALFEARKLKPALDGQYDLGGVPEAMRFFGTSKHKGKVMITVIDDDAHGQGRASG